MDMRRLLGHLQGSARKLRGAARAQATERRKGWRRWKKRYGPEVLYSFSIAVAGSDSPPDPLGYKLMEADAANVNELKSAYPRELTDRKYNILLSRVGHATQRCYLIADDEGALCGFCHMALADDLNERINHRVRVSDRQVYLFDDHIFKQHRRRGLHRFSIARRLEIAAEMGRTEAVTTITRTNTASIASFEQFGARVERTLIHLPPLHRTFPLPRLRRGGSRSAG